MKAVWTLGLAAAVGLTLIVGQSSFGNDNQKKTETHTANKPVAGQAAAAAPAKTMQSAPSMAPQLPRGWDQLNLAADQQQKIAAITQRYAPQIQQLEAKLAELKKNRHAEMTAVLNDKQRAQLAEAHPNKAPEAKTQPAKIVAERKPTDKKGLLGTGKLALPASGPDLSKLPSLEELKQRAAKEQENKAKAEKKPNK